MKIPLLAILLIMSSSAFSKAIFFECAIKNPERFGSFANISYDSDSNQASFESDWMSEKTPSASRSYKVLDVTMTGAELILKVHVGGSITGDFSINRNSLALDGNRAGTCKIVEKHNKF